MPLRASYHPHAVLNLQLPLFFFFTSGKCFLVFNLQRQIFHYTFLPTLSVYTNLLKLKG